MHTGECPGLSLSLFQPSAFSPRIFSANQHSTCLTTLHRLAELFLQSRRELRPGSQPPAASYPTLQQPEITPVSTGLAQNWVCTVPAGLGWARTTELGWSGSARAYPSIHADCEHTFLEKQCALKQQFLASGSGRTFGADTPRHSNTAGKHAPKIWP